MNIGDSVKVHLPGESPWAEVVALNDDGTWLGRIDNHLVAGPDATRRTEAAKHLFGKDAEPIPQRHPYKFGDVVRFRRGQEPELSHRWIPAMDAEGRA